MVDCATEDYLQADQQTREDLKNGMYQKRFFDQSYNRQNQHRKSQQDQANKKLNIKSQIRVCIQDA
jgi:hypothetical protein